MELAVSRNHKHKWNRVDYKEVKRGYVKKWNMKVKKAKDLRIGDLWCKCGMVRRPNDMGHIVNNIFDISVVGGKHSFKDFVARVFDKW